MITLVLVTFASQVTAQQLENKKLRTCINKQMAKWEQESAKRFDDSCKKLALQGDDCRIGTVQIDALKKDALKEITKQCSSKVKS